MKYLKYIELDGRSFIGTKLSPDDQRGTLEFWVKPGMNPWGDGGQAGNGQYAVFAGSENGKGDRWAIQTAVLTEEFVGENCGTYTNGITYFSPEWYHIVVENGELSVYQVGPMGDEDLVGQEQFDPATTSLPNVCIGTLNKEDTDFYDAPCCGVLFGKIIVNGDELLPAEDDEGTQTSEPGTIGWFDETNGVFYENSGDGSFIAGPYVSTGLEFSPASLSVGSAQTTQAISVTNTDGHFYSVASAPNWVNATALPPYDLNVTINENASGNTARSGDIQVEDSDDGTYYTIPVSQSAGAPIPVPPVTPGKPVYIGGEECYDLRIGNELVYSAYLGTELVYLRLMNNEIPLSFRILSAGTINWQYEETQGWNPRSIEYKLNNGNWTSITATTAGTEINVSAGDNISFRGGEQFYRYSTFSGSTAYFNAYGNIMSLIDPNNFANLTTLTGGQYTHQYAFEGLLQGTNVVSAKELVLPATALTQYCYQRMFQYCTSLTDTPELPATDLDSYCYGAMFMGCDKITTAPALPATTLADFCYEWMFQGCTGLTSSPTLSASTIENGSYMGMFRNCSNINYIECYATSFVSAATSLWVDGVASAGTFVRDSASTWSVGIDGIPTGWDVVPPLPVPPTPSYDEMPLTFEILSAGTIVWKATSDTAYKTIEYSLNNGVWTTITSNTGSSAPSINVAVGDKIQFRGDNNNYGINYYNESSFNGSTAYFNAYGNLLSLINSTGFTGVTSLSTQYVFKRLFKYTNVCDASNIVIPTTNIPGYGLYETFAECTNLVKAPDLPATNLASTCYNSMFYNCSNLINGPSSLPATNTYANCYDRMFYNCSKLENAPEILCSSMVIRSCREMFYGCSSLSYIKCLATNISATDCTLNWVNGVAATGTFVKDPNMTSWSTGTSGIPSGWQVVDDA